MSQRITKFNKQLTEKPKRTPCMRVTTLIILTTPNELTYLHVNKLKKYKLLNGNK
uniref:Uncharacterized protein n=1 Tax=Heterorhabditis bacteriophora TaxID=37862 RepID=A0A1I7WE92_HETBA